jgi:hypothetical protein
VVLRFILVVVKKKPNNRFWYTITGFEISGNQWFFKHKKFMLELLKLLIIINTWESTFPIDKNFNFFTSPL